MKKTIAIIIASFGIIAISCGPSAEEIKRQQEIEDSIAEVERQSAIDKASEILNNSDTIPDSTAVDSVPENEVN